MMYNYNNMLPGAPLIVPILPIPYAPSLAPMCPNMSQNRSTETEPSTEHKNAHRSVGSTPKFQRYGSQATSVKAEPGSAFESIPSPSLANKVRYLDLN